MIDTHSTRCDSKEDVISVLEMLIKVTREHFGPHDAKQSVLISGTSRQLVVSKGFDEMRIDSGMVYVDDSDFSKQWWSNDVKIEVLNGEAVETFPSTSVTVLANAIFSWISNSPSIVAEQIHGTNNIAIGYVTKTLVGSKYNGGILTLKEPGIAGDVRVIGIESDDKS